MEKSLKLITYNIHHGVKAEAITKNISDLAAQGVSIFCLQEMRQNEGKDFLLDQLLKELGADWKAEHLIKAGSHDLGLCVLWDGKSLEAVNFKPVLLPKLPQLRLLEKTLEKIISRQTKPVQRGALVCNFNFDGKRLRVINVHLDWQGGEKQRAAQLLYLRENLGEQLQVDCEILCGDFNSLGYYRFYKRRLRKVGEMVGEEFIYASPKRAITGYMQTLDHIFVKNLKVINSEILKLKGSDHFPLFAEIKI